MPKSPRSSPTRRALSVVGEDPLPDVQVVDVATVPMTDEQRAAAVQALAALIDNWRLTAHTGAELDEADRPLAA